MPSSASVHRKDHVVYVGNLCERCREQMFGVRSVCRMCQVVSYCSRRCQDRDWPEHSDKCRAMPPFPESELSSLSYRLLYAGRKFTNIYRPRVAVAALHGFFRHLDTFPSVATESPESFVQRFRVLSQRSLWVITLQEKETASREKDPRAHNVQYLVNTGKVIPQSDFPRKGVALQQLVVNRNDSALAPNGLSIIVGAFVNDRDGIGQADFSISVPVPDIAALQFAYLATTPERDLAVSAT
ncbi:hypothetical protein VNI00_016805 [Paramarasmius palmivorus]|uniref:MYND-type domain-containing protein n=1 Tax=Paramarasmius palmivorus TaxID=297713 RepID=A0AAW0BCH2_9AGAR